MTRHRIGCTALFVLAAACSGGDPGVGLPAGAIAAAAAGSGQSVAAGAAAAAPLQVSVTDGTGAPLSGVPVAFHVQLGGGSVSPTEAVTDGAGLAATVYTAGPTVGAKLVSATVGDLPPVSFVVDVHAGPAARVMKVSGDGQTGPANQALAAPLVAKVVDAFGNGVGGVAVTWSVTGGVGTLAPTAAVTDSTGASSARLTPGAIGALSAQAAVAGLTGSPVAFTAAGVATIVLVKTLGVPANYGLHDMFVRDGIAFLCAWNSGLLIYDVGGGPLGGSPADPRLIGSIVTASNGVSGGAQVHNAWWYHAPGGQKRYVFVGQEGPAAGGIGVGSSGDIHVVDVSNMAAPVEVAYFHMSGLGAPRDSAGTHNFWVDEANQVLYAAYYNGGVVALDVSGTLTGNLAAREIARIRPGGLGNTYVWGVQLAGTSLYVSDMLSGFWQLRLVGNAFQVLGGGGNVPERYGSDQWVSGGYAYSGSWGTRAAPGNAVKVWQLTAAGAPVLADSIVTTGVGTVSDVEVSADGKLLMFSTENGSGAGIYFYDLTASPTRPAFITRYLVPTGVHTTTFAQIGGRRYVFAAKDPANPALLVLDVTDIGP